MSHSYAIAIENASILDGKMLTNAEAIAFGAGKCTTLSNESSIVRTSSLLTFVAFTGYGAINNTGASVYNGNVGSGLGSTTSLAAARVNGIIFPSGITPGTNSGYSNQNTTATFSLYKNGVLIPNSSRTRVQLPSDISLLALSTIEVGETIDVRWKIDKQSSDGIEISVINRILTLIRVEN
jgi:hypothetical protein